MADSEKKYKIVIVDDDNYLVDMYATKFGLSGIDTEVFKSGEPFLEKLKTGFKPDLILLDIVVPGLSGLEMLSLMRKQKLAEGVPVVMLTNQNDEKDISEAKSLGVAGYIVKAALTPSEVVEETIKIIKNSHA